jgi:hypothetical protein
VDDENYIDIVQVENGTQTDETLMDGGCKNHIHAFLDYAITRLRHFLLILLYNVCSIFSNGGYDMLVGLPGHQSRLPKDHSGQRWFKMAQLFQRRRNCYKG